MKQKENITLFLTQFTIKIRLNNLFTNKIIFGAYLKGNISLNYYKQSSYLRSLNA